MVRLKVLLDQASLSPLPLCPIIRKAQSIAQLKAGNLIVLAFFFSIVLIGVDQRFASGVKERKEDQFAGPRR